MHEEALAAGLLLIFFMMIQPERSASTTSLRERGRRRSGLTESASRKPPAELAALTYDQYRDIRFRPDHALWRSESLPFELMFFHLGASSRPSRCA